VEATENGQKVILSVVQRQDAEKLVRVLLEHGYGSVVLSSTGSFLRKGNSTIMTVATQSAVDAIIRIVEENASERTEVRDPGISLRTTEWYVPQSLTVHAGGASIWVLDAELAGFLPLARS